MRRSLFVRTLLWVGIAVFATVGPAKAQTDKPNIVVI